MEDIFAIELSWEHIYIYALNENFFLINKIFLNKLFNT